MNVARRFSRSLRVPLLVVAMLTVGLFVPQLADTALAADESYGYDGSWESNFDGATIVEVDGSGAGDVQTVAQGINVCRGLDTDVYCHIQVASGIYIDDLQNYETQFYINRSRVKITGQADGSTILRSESQSHFYLNGVDEIIISPRGRSWALVGA